MLYNYKGFHGCDSKCDIKVYGNIVVATQLEGNSGTSITNMAEDIATDIAKMHKIKLKNLIWFECYPDFFDGLFQKVMFEIEHKRFVKPNWIPASKETIENTIKDLKETTNIKYA